MSVDELARKYNIPTIDSYRRRSHMGDVDFYQDLQEAMAEHAAGYSQVSTSHKQYSRSQGGYSATVKLKEGMDITEQIEEIFELVARHFGGPHWRSNLSFDERVDEDYKVQRKYRGLSKLFGIDSNGRYDRHSVHWFAEYLRVELDPDNNSLIAIVKGEKYMMCDWEKKWQKFGDMINTLGYALSECDNKGSSTKSWNWHIYSSRHYNF